MMRTNLLSVKNKLTSIIFIGLMTGFLIGIDPLLSTAQGAVSASGTTVPPASQIVDNQNNTWGLSSSGTVLENGRSAGYSSNVTLLLYYNGIIYQENSSGGWWSWTGGLGSAPVIPYQPRRASSPLQAGPRSRPRLKS